MKPSIGDEERSAIKAELAPEIASPSSGLFNKKHKRRVIPRSSPCAECHVSTPIGNDKHGMPFMWMNCSAMSCESHEWVIRNTALDVVTEVVTNGGGTKAINFRNAHPFARGERSFASGGPESTLLGRKVHHRHGHISIFDKGDEGAPCVDTIYEAGGAVDRIYVPTAVFGGVPAELFADDSVVSSPLSEDVAQD